MILFQVVTAIALMPSDSTLTKLHVDIPKDLKEFGSVLAYAYGKLHGDRGSIRKLIASVLAGEWLLIPSAEQWSENERTAVLQTLIKFQNQEFRHQPFELLYAHGSGDYQQYSVHYGKVVRHEKRLYLDCWTTEKQKQPDLPRLAHNHSFRLDRIQKIGGDLEAPWRVAGLDAIEVTLEIRGQLAQGSRFRKQAGDRLDKVGDTLQVRRSINSFFWFQREILPYGRDCVVLAPTPVRDRVGATIQAMYQNYF